MRKKLLLSLLLAGGLAAGENMLPNGDLAQWQSYKPHPKLPLTGTADSVPQSWQPVTRQLKTPDGKITAYAGIAKEDTGENAPAVKLTSTRADGYIALAHRNVKLQKNKYYRLAAKIRGENIVFDLKDKNGAGPMLMLGASSPESYWIPVHNQRRTKEFQGTFGWKPLEEIFSSENDGIKHVYLGLFHATGTLWIDDITFTEVPEEDYLRQMRSRITSKITPTAWRIPYGPHNRNRLSFYPAQSAAPAPVLCLIHGGGWLGGDGLLQADLGRSDGTIRQMNAAGISVAVINYRLGHKLPVPVYDAARAVQFLRANAAKFNIDKTRFAATGFSAGATTSLWLAVHPDIADPKAEDPVLRESSKMSCAFTRGTQATIDPFQIKAWGIENAIKHPMICRAGGFADNKQMYAGYEKEKALYHEFSSVNFVGPDTPPIRIYGGNTASKDWIHHPVFAIEFKKEADRKGAPDVDLVMPGQPAKDPSDLAFLQRVFKMKKK